jgi:hypothetical protein
MDGWSTVTREVMDARPFAFVGFFVYVSITGFFMLNLMIAVVCESLIQLKEATKVQVKGQHPKSLVDTERWNDEMAESTLDSGRSAFGTAVSRQRQSPTDEAFALGGAHTYDAMREYHERFRAEMQLSLQEIRDEVRTTQSEMREILKLITEHLQRR